MAKSSMLIGSSNMSLASNMVRSIIGGEVNKMGVSWLGCDNTSHLVKLIYQLIHFSTFSFT